jgi:hypothetical protein
MRDADEDSQATDDEAMSGSEPSEYSYDAGDSDDNDGADAGASSSDDAPAGSDGSSDGDDAGPTPADDGDSRRLGYRVITADSMKRLQQGAIDEVGAIWGCGASVAKTLLMAYMWDKERLLSEAPGGERGGGGRMAAPRAWQGGWSGGLPRAAEKALRWLVRSPPGIG